MTGQPTTDQIPGAAPPQERLAAAPTRARELPMWQCPRCAAISTHYLTCPSLRLPPGYHLSQDRGPERTGHRGQRRITPRPSLVPGRHWERPPSGPDHPDWRYPPQH